MTSKPLKYEAPVLVPLSAAEFEKGHGATCTTGGFQQFCQDGVEATSNCDVGPSTVNCIAGTGFGS